MHLRHAGCLAAIVIALLVGSLPVAAQEANPSVKDLGNNIYLVNGRQGPIPNLLPAEEVEKIAALQSAPFGALYQIVSPVSPDDQTVLAATTDDVFFLDIHDGSMVSIDLETGIIPVTNFFWLDDDTVAAYGIIISSPPVIGLITYDRRTGELSVDENFLGEDHPVRQELPDGLPVLISENRHKALIVVVPESSDEELDLQVTSPLSGVDYRIHPVDQGRQAPFRQRFAAELAANPSSRRLADLSSLFDPLSIGSPLLLDEKATLYVADLVSGEYQEVLTIEPNSLIMDASFSRDGGKFSIVTQEIGKDPARDARDGALQSEVIYRDVTGNLPPAENPLFKGNVLTMHDAISGETKQWRAADGDGVVYTGTSWSTDNQTLMVKVSQPSRTVGRRHPQYFLQFLAGSSLRFYNSAGQEIRRLAPIEISDINMSARFLSPDELLIASTYRLDTHPYYYNLRSGEFRKIADRAGTFGTVVSTNRSREIVFTYNSFTDPVDIYRMGWDGKAFARLTWLNEEVRQLSQTKQYPVSFTLRDRSTHTGVLILPASVQFPPRNVPIIVWQEGGPTTQVENAWFALAESPHALLPNFGFGMLVVPLYGRYGVGPDRFEALADGTNYGQIDIDAQAEIVGQLRSRGWASKVGITGCSYGGYFATQSIIRHPTTYNAAHTMCSLVDLFTEWSRGFNAVAPWFEGLPPPYAQAEYSRDSPAYNAAKIRTPLLAFHGTRDFLPITVMENFMLQVINNKVPAKMLKFQDADHGFLRSTPPHLSVAYEQYGAQEQIMWFRTYLK